MIMRTAINPLVYLFLEIQKQNLEVSLMTRISMWISAHCVIYQWWELFFKDVIKYWNFHNGWKGCSWLNHLRNFRVELWPNFFVTWIMGLRGRDRLGLSDGTRRYKVSQKHDSAGLMGPPDKQHSESSSLARDVWEIGSIMGRKLRKQRESHRQLRTLDFLKLKFKKQKTK